MLTRADAPRCPDCGASVDASWQNCASCGSALSGPLAAAAVDPAPTEPPGPDARRRVLVAAVILLVVAAVSATIPTVRLQRTRHDLTQARRDLRNTNETLAAARRELASQATSSAKLRTELESAQSSLRDAQHSADLQGGQLAVIRRCLNDVQDVQDATARHDQPAANAAADAANRDCAEAQAVL